MRMLAPPSSALAPTFNRSPWSSKIRRTIGIPSPVPFPTPLVVKKSFLNLFAKLFGDTCAIVFNGQGLRAVTGAFIAEQNHGFEVFIRLASLQDRISGIGDEVGVDLPDLRAPTYKQGIVWDFAVDGDRFKLGI